MKKKNYVYKLVYSGTCYNNLEAAARDAFYTMKGKAITTRLTNPVVVKVKGGYDVKAFTSEGHTRSRHIDVFVLKSHSDYKCNIQYMSTRYDSHWKIEQAALRNMVFNHEHNMGDTVEEDED